MFQQTAFAVLLCSTVLFFSASATDRTTDEEIAMVNKALMAAVKLENHCTTSADCASVPIGAQACGGPNGYAIYSTKASNVEDITELAALTSTLERKYNEENAVVSICAFFQEPSVQCNENKCVAESFIYPH